MNTYYFSNGNYEYRPRGAFEIEYQAKKMEKQLTLATYYALPGKSQKRTANVSKSLFANFFAGLNFPVLRSIFAGQNHK